MTFISMITGTFNNYLIFTMIIFVHELGHFLCGILVGWRPIKICIYPYGGCTFFNNLINSSIFKEFLVLICGPIIQVVFYLLIKKYFSFNDYILLKRYNLAILFFNLLPIYPLDGGRLINLIFSLFFPYKLSIKINIFLSLIIIFFIFIVSKSLSFYVVLLFLIFSVIKEYNNIGYLYNKFLLERVMYKFNFKRKCIIKSKNSFYRSRKHLIFIDKKYYTESEFLQKIL